MIDSFRPVDLDMVASSAMGKGDAKKILKICSLDLSCRDESIGIFAHFFRALGAEIYSLKVERAKNRPFF